MRNQADLIVDTAPFPDKLIKQLPTGYNADYVEWHEYNQRLLLQHPDHDYLVTSVTYAPGYHFPVMDDDGKKRFDDWAPPVWAIGVAFTIDGCDYHGVGEDDSPTSAESNAYKRACAHAGIGLHLYNRDGYWLHGRLIKDSDDANPELSGPMLPSV